jgi:hypothetical protein
VNHGKRSQQSDALQSPVLDHDKTSNCESSMSAAPLEFPEALELLTMIVFLATVQNHSGTLHDLHRSIFASSSNRFRKTNAQTSGPPVSTAWLHQARKEKLTGRQTHIQTKAFCLADVFTSTFSNDSNSFVEHGKEKKNKGDS